MTAQWDYLISDEVFNDLVLNYCNDFTALDKKSRYDPITGRDKEIGDAILIMLQRGRKNVCLLAPAGVGKTAAVIGLAQKINSGDVPEMFKNARVIEADLSRMASGTSSKAEFQSRFIPFMKGLAERYHNENEPRYILFLDELHQIMPDCPGSSFAGLSDTIKTYLTQGDIMVMGATTLDEYRLYVAQDDALDRRFQKITLKQPNTPETYQIMKNIRAGYEKHHNVTISDESLMLIVHLTNEHMRKRNQPDKSIITADAAMAYHVFAHGTNQETSQESIYYMVARETGLNANALHDEKLIEKVAEQVAHIEERGEVEEEEDGRKYYDPAAGMKNIKMNKDYQAELAAETAADKRREANSRAALKEKADNAGKI